MIMMDNGEVESESSSDDEMLPLEDCSDVEVVKPVDGVVLVTRRALSIQPKEDADVEQQKVCNMIIDGRTCTNVVEKQVSVSFAIGNYKDEVLYDVVPMEVEHILLGRPWQFDRKVIHNGYINSFSFIYNKQKITLASLSPKQVFVDQIKMRKARECEKSKEKESERTKEKESERTKEKK
ncbi:hypothetical protein CR513_15851, partial [Mucuna pruriens]